ncbi:MAG: cytochrome c oxidase subunit II [Dehalococcoidia bacterium]|nr:cytochrome c oxidase subunit II [Dehalococcoidia bacterium]
MVALLWAVLTAIGEVLVLTLDPFPLAAAEEADLVDEAFFILMVMGTPVLTFVLAVLGYSVFRFRISGEPNGDGPPIQSHGATVRTWVLLTTALTIVVMIFPGATGWLELRDRAQDEDLVIEVQGLRFAWLLTYPEYEIVTGEMVLPVGQRVRFDVTSKDVLHSFWIPAFRMKIDAVPGMVTNVYVTPNETGTVEDDYGFRLQCAEMCGTFHSIMQLPVRVVEPEEFDDWVAQMTP